MSEADIGVGEAAAAIARKVVGAVGRERHALAAELVVSQLLGTVEAAPLLASGQDRAAAGDELLGELIRWAVVDGSPAGLAFLRVATVLGPASTRAAASAAADRLAGCGVADRPWAATVGRPQLVQAWWYGDVFVQQESVNMLFAYGHREHGVCVLIDHQLGGGVKDCWIAEGRRARGLRARSAAGMAADPDTRFEDIDACRAVQVLRAALAEPACPNQDDQVRDVKANLALLRARVALMAECVDPVLAPSSTPRSAAVRPRR